MKIKRLTKVISLLACTLLTTHATTVIGQEKKLIQIGVSKIATHAALDADEKGFTAGLASVGFKEGVNVRYLRMNAEGDMAKAEAIAKQFVEQKVDLIHSIATPTTQAIVKYNKSIPVVFSSVTDPVAAGIVPKDSAPGKKTGSNLTGVSDKWPVALQMKMYASILPTAKRWGTIYNPAEMNAVTHIKAMRDAAKSLGLNLVEVHVANRKEVAQAAQSLVGKVDAITITSDNTAVADLASIVRVCNEKKIPLFAGDVDSVASGAVAAYGLDYYLVGFSAGKKAGLILKGSKPGDIPWGPVEKFSLVINQKAAAAQGVTLTPEFLSQADKILN
jgi:putative tryptophan/tyrosine transport system substrate-binding protein